jgi:hypothetical protein
MGASIYRDMLRRVREAVTFDELRALRRFSRQRLQGDERMVELDEAIERRAMSMIADAESVASDRR